MVTPSQAQNRFEFSKRPEEAAMIPQDSSFPQFPLTCKKEPKTVAPECATCDRMGYI